MANVHKVRALLAVMALSAAPVAHAQSTTPATEKFFVNVNFGRQLATRTVGSGAPPFTIYDETATLTTTAQPVNPGPVIDMGVGYRLPLEIMGGSVYAGVALWRYSDKVDASWTASVPNPLFFNRPKITQGTFADLARTEQGAALHGIWVYPLLDKMDLALSAGVSFVKLEQDVVSGFSVAPGTQNATVTAETKSAQGFGPYVGADVIYNLMSKIGVGGYAKFAGAKVDIGQPEKQSVGGMMVGGGVRVKF